MSFFFCCLYAVFVLSRMHEWIPALVPPSLLDIIIVCSMIVCMVEFHRGHLEWPHKLPQYTLMAGFFFAALLSDIMLTNFANFVNTFLMVGKLLLVFVLISLTCNSPKRIRFVYFLFVLIAIFIVFNCILQVTVGRGLFNDPPLVMYTRGVLYVRARYLGILADPNDTALFLNFCIPLVFPLLMRRNPIHRAVCWLAIAVMIWGIYLTQSRGGYVAMCAMVIVLLHQILDRRRFSIVLVAVIGLLIVAVPTRLGSSTLADQERTDLWGQANVQFKQHPLTGVGANRIMEYIEGGKVPHNSFVHAYSELGLIGYFFWLTLLAFCIVSCYRVSLLVPENDDDRLLVLEARTMVASLVGYSAAAFMLSRTYFVPFFLLLALATAIYGQAAHRVGVASLNVWSGLRQRNVWHYPALCVSSIAGIYVFILVVNRLA